MCLKFAAIACFIACNTILCLPHDIQEQQHTVGSTNAFPLVENVTLPPTPTEAKNNTVYSNGSTPNLETIVNESARDAVVLEENENRFNHHSVANLDF